MPNDTTQIKFTIDSDIVSVFKARCASNGVSMASVIRQWMIERQPTNDKAPKTLTRPKRRKTVAEIIDMLNEVLEMEEHYRDSIPEQFEQRIYGAEHACEQLAAAIDCLKDAY